MAKYNDLIQVLRACSDQSANDLAILSPDLRDKKDVLDRFSIKYEEQSEGVFVDLAAQPIKIFKTKASAVKYLKESDFSADILVVEVEYEKSEIKNIEYLASSEPHSSSRMFENLEYFFKFRGLFLEKNIANYNDESLNRLIFLSSNHGRLHVTYGRVWSSDFYDSENDIEHQYRILEKNIDHSGDYADFFRESFIEYAKAIPEEDLRLIKSLKNIKHIVESANRNFELYKHNFSFSEFKKELNEDKDKYLKEYQTNLSDFLSKVASMPIQFGVYIYLMVRFGEELLPIIATTVIILFWSIFKILTVNRIIDNIEEYKSKFQQDLNLLLQKSGMEESDVGQARSQVSRKFDKSITLIKSYRLFVIVFSVCALFICLQLIMNITCV